MRYLYYVPLALPIMLILVFSLLLSSCASPEPPPTATPVSLSPTPVAQTTDIAASPAVSMPTETSTAPQQTRLPVDTSWLRVGRQIFAPSTDTAPLDLETSDEVSIPIAVTVAPDGGYLAYVDNSSIPARLMLRDLASGTTDSVTAEESSEVSEVRFAPDSSALVYTLIGQQSWQIRVRDLATGAEQVLQQGSLLPGEDRQLPRLPLPVAWTPAGLWVRLVLWGTDAPAQGLALLDPTSGSITAELQREHLAAYPAPDGTRVALMTGMMPIGAIPQTALVVVDLADGTEQTIMPERQGFIRMLKWSPDGTWLLYTSAESYETSTITLTALRADGSDERSLIFGAPEVALSLHDLDWFNGTTPLLLVTDDLEGQLALHQLPLETFTPGGLQSIASMVLPDAQMSIVQIVYVP